jgi:hypothetical protein
MSKFSLEQLSEGIRQRNVGSQNRRLVEKWARTGLLRGLDGVTRENMATLLENQASDMLIRESSTVGAGGGSGTASGDLRGFTNVAFPIVRRVFGGLVANELVSIQPMSLPAGLLFYLDYTYGSTESYQDQTSTDDGAAVANKSVYTAGQSIYNNPAGKGVRSGSLGVGGQYDLAGSGFTRVHSSSAPISLTDGTIGSGSFRTGVLALGSCETTGTDGRFLQFDPQITNLIDSNAVVGTGAPAGNGQFYFALVPTTGVTNGDSTLIREWGLTCDAVATARPLTETVQGGTGIVNVRRLNQLGTLSGGVFTPDPFAPLSGASTRLLTVVTGVLGAAAEMQIVYPIDPTLSTGTGDTLVIPTFESNFASDPAPKIPEIDIKVESIPVVATTRKLRARWSPELAQDLNAYHSLDAEVELTQILSEQVALEIDREILGDLLSGADTNYFWSRAPGKFVNKTNGSEVLASSATAPGPAFTGTVREWYETLIETIIDVGNEIHRKTLRGAANFIVVSPDVATMLEASVYYRPVMTIDGDGQVATPFSLGAERVGTLSNRFTVYKDPYFPRNKVLVGYKGGSYLETGYVYAPYVPLIVTPTIFAPEDFTPRKGVMTRYGKKMVRNDFYGTVTVLDLNII